jgi:2-polyprenyl-6-methoxyphenol hydroxylase-like FAD-dependent oxidoreductase
MSDLKIAIIGAGPAGCILGRLLHLANIRFTIFEGESSPNERSQGGTLDLRENTGLAAIKEALLYDEFLKYARYDGEALAITDKHLKRYFVIDVASNSKASVARPEIDRRQLRSLLLSSLPEGSVKWGKRLRSISEDRTLHFDDGDESGFDLVVGADGAWSKVRSLLSDQLPAYSGICGTEFKISDAETRYPDLHKLVNRGSLFSWGDGHSIFGQQIGDGSLMVAEWGGRDESWAKENNAAKLDPAVLKEMLARQYQDWAPDLQKLIAVSDDSDIVTRSLFMLPADFRWQNKPGVTLIGDAAHVMVPFAGEGANISMADAMELARYIKESKNKEELMANVVKFEEDMFVRAKASQTISSASMKDMFFTAGAPRTTIERYLVRMIRHMKGKTFAAVASIGIYAYFWGFKLLN